MQMFFFKISQVLKLKKSRIKAQNEKVFKVQKWTKWKNEDISRHFFQTRKIHGVDFELKSVFFVHLTEF